MYIISCLLSTGIYLTLSLAVACASVILTVLVLKTYNVSPNQKEVPRWVRTLILQGLARITRCERLPVKKLKRRLSAKPRLQRAVDQIVSKVKAEKTSPQAFNIDLNKLLSAAQKTKDPENSENLTASELAVSPANTDAISTVSSIRLSAIDDILTYLKLIVSQEEEETVENDTNDEWRQVALVIDRLLFWIFLVINFISTFIILIVMPNAKS